MSIKRINKPQVSWNCQVFLSKNATCILQRKLHKLYNLVVNMPHLGIGYLFVTQFIMDRSEQKTIHHLNHLEMLSFCLAPLDQWSSGYTRTSILNMHWMQYQDSYQLWLHGLLSKVCYRIFCSWKQVHTWSNCF